MVAGQEETGVSARPAIRRASLRSVLGVLAGAAITISAIMLERVRVEADPQDIMIGQTPATYYKGTPASDTVAVVTHGFAGSRQMMQAISLTLARSGFAVVSFDFLGHGRNEVPMSSDVTQITGTTEDLVQQTLKVVDAAQALTAKGQVALVGHSMATDVVVRAAARRPAVSSVIAISMYSEAVTAAHPRRLLVVSGAQEGRLRDVAVGVVNQIGAAGEGETVHAVDVTRRAVVAPFVGHVGVLWSPTTLSEAAAWLGADPVPVRTGPIIALLLISIVLTFWPLSTLLGPRQTESGPSRGRATLAALLPAPFAFAGCLWAGPSLGLLGFGALAAFLAVWGSVALIVLRPTFALRRADITAFLLLLVWGLGVFALALDRYAAAFVPVGPRAEIALVLLPGALLFSLADRFLVEGRRGWERWILRVPFLFALGASLTVRPQDIGVLFTVLPVMILFFGVYGTMTRWARAQSGTVGPAVASGIILAWSLAASTPLFTAM